MSIHCQMQDKDVKDTVGGYNKLVARMDGIIKGGG